MHNVRVDALAATAEAAASDASVAAMPVSLKGVWNTDSAEVQFHSDVGFAAGSVRLSADFPDFLGGDGRAPAPLAYCFYGAMCCYGATFATQAAMAGVEIRSMEISLDLEVDFRTALGLGEFPPMSSFDFEITVDSPASAEELEAVRQLTNERCPAIWAMNNPVPYAVTVTQI